MAAQQTKTEKRITDDLKELVIARLDILPPDKSISIGSVGKFTKKELIEHVKKEDEIGQKVVEVELAFLKALKEGILLEKVLHYE